MGTFEWNTSTGEFPEIDPHGKTKHEVIRNYLLTYLKIVGGKFPYDGRLIMNLVDDFAGGGVYKKPQGGIHEGSPLIFINTVQEAQVILSAQKDYEILPTFYFVEKNFNSFLFLKNYLKKEVQKEYFDRVNFFNDLFEDKIDDIIKDIKKRGRANRTIFLLDQTGYKDVTINIINKIFKEIPKSEILLTLNVDWLSDYVSENEKSIKIFENLNLPFDVDGLKDEKKKQKNFRAWFQFRLFEAFRKVV